MTDNILEITEEIIDGKCKLTAKGHIDSNNADILLEKLEDSIKKGNINIILNMYDIKYLSSIGIRIILKIYKKAAEKGGKFRIERPSKMVKNVLGLAALNDMLLTN